MKKVIFQILKSYLLNLIIENKEVIFEFVRALGGF